MQVITAMCPGGHSSKSKDRTLQSEHNIDDSSNARYWRKTVGIAAITLKCDFQDSCECQSTQYRQEHPGSSLPNLGLARRSPRSAHFPEPGNYFRWNISIVGIVVITSVLNLDIEAWSPKLFPPPPLALLLSLP